MAKHSTQAPIIIHHLAEGTPPEDPESREVATPLRTSTSPIVGSGAVAPRSADTGLLQPVSVSAEGNDAADAQDASLTTEETTKLETKPETQADTSTRPMQTQKVLIIEDSTELAEVIEATLVRMKLETSHLTHGGKALTRIDEFKPDVILLDLGLPDIPGWKILDALKERQDAAPDSGEPMPAIIVITAYGDPANRLVGKLQGIYDYLIKPFTPDEIERVVRKALGGAAK